MPVISFSFRDFQDLLGRTLLPGKFSDLVALYAKGEVEWHRNDEVKVALDDTNMPYMWCVEGLARFFRGILEIETGLPEIKAAKAGKTILVDHSVKKIRPYIACFAASGKITEYLLEQLIQLQEKFCEGYGRKRKKVSIGLYSGKHVAFPVSYKAVNPDSVKFTPLEMNEEMNLPDVLERHPKGKAYGSIIKEFAKYPVLVDNYGQVLSLVPIINSNTLGKLKVGDSEILFEATGTDEDAVELAANLFAQNLYERRFELEKISIESGQKKWESPVSFSEKMEIKNADVEFLTGLKLSQSEIKNLLEKARYDVSGNSVTIPDYRRDILHVFDVIEDIAIAYGFDNIESAPLESYTAGSSTEMNGLADTLREIAVGLGFQEILSPILSSKTVLQEKMEQTGNDMVEIENFMSETFSAVRNRLIPIMLEVLSKNKHNEYPQKIFEQGLVSRVAGQEVEDREMISLATSHAKADFTEIKQQADAIFRSLGLDYSIERLEGNAFIPGRAGKIKVGGKDAGILGEISPKVLKNWQLEMPVAALELDLTRLMSIIST